VSAEFAPMHLDANTDALLAAEVGYTKAAHVDTRVEEPLAIHLNVGTALRLVEVRDGVGCTCNVDIAELRICRLDLDPLRVGHTAFQKDGRLAAEQLLAADDLLEELATRCRNLAAVSAAPDARCVAMQLHLHPVGRRPLGLEPDVGFLSPVEANVDIGTAATHMCVGVKGERTVR